MELAVALGLGATLLAFGAAGCGKGGGKEPAQGAGQAQAAPAPSVVRVTPARTETVTRDVAVTGSVQALQSISLSPKIAARVVSVAGREGAAVRAGQVVVQQDTSDLDRQVQQRLADVESARARLAQAETNLRLQGTTNRVGVSNAQAALAAAQAQLKSARANLALTKRPQRTQEVAVAENSVAQAQANYDKAKTDRERYEQLTKEGASAQSVLDQYVTQERVALANLNSAKQQLDIARQGGRQESIVASQGQVQQAEEAVRQAESNLRQARANTQQVEVRRGDVESARAALSQAQAALAVARQAVEDAAIRSPIDGQIAQRQTEPGQQAAPGQSVAQVVALDTVYFEAKVPDTDVTLLAPGQPVAVTIDAFRGRTFPGRIARIYPTGSATSRTFNVRVEIPNTDATLRPGLFARGTVTAERRTGVVTVPQEALLRGTAEGDAAGTVFTVENGAARQRKVETGLTTPDGLRVEVSGLPAGASVIVVGQRGIKDGDRVTVQQQNGGGTPSANTAEAGSTAGGEGGAGTPSR
jgi:RND family efflux transporter MFP subunit